jgi:hypothetical protein
MAYNYTPKLINILLITEQYFNRITNILTIQQTIYIYIYCHFLPFVLTLLTNSTLIFFDKNNFRTLKLILKDLVLIKFIYDIFFLYNFTFVYLVDYLNDA